MEPVLSQSALLTGDALTNLEYAPLAEIMGRVTLGGGGYSTATRRIPATWRP